jgi:lantibiotic modifying enzyme
LAILRILPEFILLSAAVRLGGSLLKAARNNKDIRRSSFGSDNKLQRLPNGFSDEHSEMAHALLELFSVTRNVDCGRAALRLFRNEATIINEGTRLLSRRKSACSRQFHELSYVANEISGSQSVPGIALARIRAYEVLREGKLKSYAAPGIRSARKTLENWLCVARGDLSLTRGIVGSAEVLIRAHQVFGSTYQAERSLAIQVARQLANNSLLPKEAGPDYRITDTPNLMLGLAGIGHFLLRLHEPKLASLPASKEGSA